MEQSFRSNVALKQASSGTVISDNRFAGMRRLAAEIIKHAIIDYYDSLLSLQQANKNPFLYNREDFARFRTLLNEARGFLTDNTLWHQILDLDPEYFRRLISTGKLPRTSWRTEKRV